ncbi:hypothetical protein DICPUDRAFT_153902 [Dictyostelium purpureum]|uniref:SAM domain-containing protein n=1 Tax=Dictyostelium purpureum TaxID=5786 RepID=F0ZQ15_DICPU|nr:uncharacterized protein DICPUDRAFT_153902 [Dictyostelium purpureum]EGC33981.1 hypothetical protein DICPUDRAFT_153902 [Dictyostelium purpureum]|eukprot:XP_003289514.1 hypothetical protein DICPUDRAFT_153902 [Dictyostelium purpureum]
MLPTTISDITTPTAPAACASNEITTTPSQFSSFEQDIEYWDEDKVFQWALKNRQGQYYADILRINHIDGRALLNLTEKDVSLMGISIGPAKNLLADIHSIKYKRNINWAYEKVSDINDFVQLYFPFHKLKEMGTDGFYRVKDYSVASYSYLRDNLGTIGTYIPFINKNNSILPDRNPLLLQDSKNLGGITQFNAQQPTQQPVQQQLYPTQSQEQPIQLYSSYEQQPQQPQQEQQFERQEIIQLQQQILNEYPNQQLPIFDQQIVGQPSEEESKTETY